MQGLRHYLLAVQFFTRLPVTGRLAEWVGFSPQMLRAAAGHFPGVGWLVGLVAVLVFGALHRALGHGPGAALVAATLATAATVYLTGAFHEDGLADVADGLGGASTREHALEIMKDSRLGSFGTLAVVLALLAKVSLLAQLAEHGALAPLAALALAHPLSRLWPLVTIRLLPHVGDSTTSKSKPLADRISARALLCALLWSAPPLLLAGAVLGGAALAGAVLASAAGAAWMHWRYARRLQGFTGDCLGGTQQIAELGCYLGAALVLGLARA